MRATIGLALASILTAGTAGAQVREFSRTMDLAAGGTLRVEGTKGSIRLTSWTEPRVEIRARIDRPKDVDEDYGRRAVDATRIDVTGDSRSVSVASNYDDVPTRDGRDGWSNRTVPAVHFEIRAPRNIALQIDSDRGPVTLSGFEGTFEITVDRGELELRDVSGVLRVDIDRGRTSRIERLRGSLRIDADRTNLNIDAEALDRDSRIEIDRGDVALRIPEGQRLTVRTDMSRRGRFRTDLPINWSSNDPRRSEGRLNGGGAELFLESDRANIELRRR